MSPLSMKLPSSHRRQIRDPLRGTGPVAVRGRYLDVGRTEKDRLVPQGNNTVKSVPPARVGGRRGSGGERVAWTRMADAEAGAHLTRLAAGGHDAALDESFRLYWPRVYALCLRALGDPDDAADAAMGVVLSAWRGVPGLRDPNRFIAWITLGARRACVSAIRRRAGLACHEIAFSAAGAWGRTMMPAPPSPTPLPPMTTSAATRSTASSVLCTANASMPWIPWIGSCSLRVTSVGGPACGSARRRACPRERPATVRTALGASSRPA